MTAVNTFFAVYTGVFFTLYTYSISHEFKSISNKLNSLNAQNVNINNELIELKKDFNNFKDSKKFKM